MWVLDTELKISVRVEHVFRTSDHQCLGHLLNNLKARFKWMGDGWNEEGTIPMFMEGVPPYFSGTATLCS